MLLCVTYLFLKLKLKRIIKGFSSEGMETIKTAIMTELRCIPEEPFQAIIRNVEEKNGKCINFQCNYCEG